MSIKPTTRLGYRHSIRPHKWRLKELLDNRDQTNVEKFVRPRAPRRKAGTRINAELITEGIAPTSDIKGDENISRQNVDFISEDLDPDDLDETKSREYI